MNGSTIISGAALRASGDLCHHKTDAVAIGGGIALAKGRVHEVTGDAADMFAIMTAAQLAGPVIWVGDDRNVRSLAPTGLQRFLDPARLIVTSGVDRTEILYATEQSLRSDGVACVIAEIGGGPDLDVSRRLQLAAEEGGAIGLLILTGRAQTSACQTRWVCKARVDDGAGWDWRLVKNKGGPTTAWRVNWTEDDDARADWQTGFISLAPLAAA